MEIVGPQTLGLMVAARVTMKMPSVTWMKLIPKATPIGVDITGMVLKVVTVAVTGIGVGIL
jgi:hypothetical protein